MAKQDAFTLIKEDHDRFREMFSDYDDLPDDDYRAKLDLALRLYEALAAHGTMEEEIFYPAIREHASEHGVEMLLERYEEHHVADEVIAELKELDIEDETYDAKFKVLRENVEHHLDEEEEELFPEARKALGDNATEIGEKMRARRDELLAATPTR